MSLFLSEARSATWHEVVTRAIDAERGTRDAQSLLGHTTEGMTANYIRHKVGKKVRPLR